jgi:hypothetical protein
VRYVPAQRAQCGRGEQCPRPPVRRGH